MTLTMDFDTVKAAGSGLGTCSSIVMDETTCMVKTLRRIARFYHAESCGQCTPCREGTGWLHRVLTRIVDGKGTKADIDMLVDVANKIEGHTICAFGDAAAWPVQSFIKHFRHEFEYMVEHKGRSIVDDAAVGGRMSTPRTDCAAAGGNAAARRPQRRQRRGQWRAAEGAQRADDHRGDGPGRDLRAAVLLSPEAVDRGQLPHVPGRGREGAEAAAGVRDARRRRHEDLHALEACDLGAEGDDGVPAHQSSARLPDLRSGRRVRAAGSRDGLRARRVALHRSASASSKTRTSGPWCRRT